MPNLQRNDTLQVMADHFSQLKAPPGRKLREKSLVYVQLAAHSERWDTVPMASSRLHFHTFAMSQKNPNCQLGLAGCSIYFEVSGLGSARFNNTEWGCLLNDFRVDIRLEYARIGHGAKPPSQVSVCDPSQIGDVRIDPVGYVNVMMFGRSSFARLQGPSQALTQ